MLDFHDNEFYDNWLRNMKRLKRKIEEKRNKSHIDPKWNYVAHIEDEIVEKNNAPTVTIYPSNNLTLSSSEFVSHHENDDFFVRPQRLKMFTVFFVPIFHLFNHFSKRIRIFYLVCHSSRSNASQYVYRRQFKWECNE